MNKSSFLARASVAVLLSGMLLSGCGGAGSLLGTAAKGFVTYLEKVVGVGGVVSYLLRREDQGTGDITDLGSFAEAVLVGLLEGPGDLLYSLIPSGASSTIVRLDDAGAVDIATLAEGAAAISSGKSGFTYLSDLTLAAGEALRIRTVPFTGGTPTSVFDVSVSAPTVIQNLTVSRFDDTVFFASKSGSATEAQIYRVTGPTTTQLLAPEFAGIVRKIQHVRIGTVDYIYYLEDDGTATNFGRVSLSTFEKEVLQSFPGTEPASLTGDYQSSRVNFGLTQGGVSRVFTVEDTVVTESEFQPDPDVVGAVIR